MDLIIILGFFIGVGMRPRYTPLLLLLFCTSSLMAFRQTMVATLPTSYTSPISSSAASVGSVAVFGFSFSNFMAYNTSNGATTTIEFPSSFIEAFHTIVAVGQYLVFAPGNGYTDDFVVFDSFSSKTTWYKSSYREFMYAAAVAGPYALFSGSNDLAANDPYVVVVFNSATQTWFNSSLSAPRSYITAVSTQRFAVFGGGKSKLDGSASTVVDIFDPTSMTWRTMALSTPRETWSATAIGNKAIFVGGKTAEILDLDANTVTLKTLETTPSSAYSFFNRYAYFPSENAQVYEYDGDTKTWRLFEIAENVTEICQAASVNNDVIFFCGRLAIQYTPSTKRIGWQIPLTFGASLTPPITVNGKIYILAQPEQGYTGYYSPIIALDFTTTPRFVSSSSTITPVDITLPYQTHSFVRGKTAATNPGKYALFMSKNSNETELFDSESQSWSQSSMLNSYSSFVVTSAGNYSFMVAETSANQIDIFDAESLRWTADPKSATLYQSRVASAGNYAIIGAGQLRRSDMHCWNTYPTLASCSFSLSYTAQWRSVFSAGDYFIVGGGYDDGYSSGFRNVDIINPTKQTHETGLMTKRKISFVGTSALPYIFIAGSPPSSDPTVDVYNVETGEWSTDFVESGPWYGGVSVGNFGFFIKGDTAAVFNKASQTWSKIEIEGSFNIPVVVGHYLLFGFGNNVVIFDSIAETWTKTQVTPGMQITVGVAVKQYALFSDGSSAVVLDTSDIPSTPIAIVPSSTQSPTHAPTTSVPPTKAPINTPSSSTQVPSSSDDPLPEGSPSQVTPNSIVPAVNNNLTSSGAMTRILEVLAALVVVYSFL